LNLSFFILRENLVNRKAASTGLCLLLASCVTHQSGEIKKPEGARRQLETLETIASLEQQAALYAEALEEIQKARVYIRPQASIVLLTPREGAEIRPESIQAINLYLEATTGLNRQQITIKKVDKRGKGP
jgi:hypothetical protein